LQVACSAPKLSNLPDLQKRRDRSDEGGDWIKDSNSNSTAADDNSPRRKKKEYHRNSLSKNITEFSHSSRLEDDGGGAEVQW
jgi:hypothetical protein